MKYLLDTNVCIELIRARPNTALRTRLTSHPREAVHICAIVRAELFYGAYKSTHVEDGLRRTREFVSVVPTLLLSDAAAERAGEIRAGLERTGQVIGPHDVLIAATALAHDATLVTHNTAEFSRVPGLRLEDWQAS